MRANMIGWQTFLEVPRHQFCGETCQRFIDGHMTGTKADRKPFLRRERTVLDGVTGRSPSACPAPTRRPRAAAFWEFGRTARHVRPEGIQFPRPADHRKEMHFADQVVQENRYPYWPPPAKRKRHHGKERGAVRISAAYGMHHHSI